MSSVSSDWIRFFFQELNENVVHINIFYPNDEKQIIEELGFIHPIYIKYNDDFNVFKYRYIIGQLSSVLTGVSIETIKD